MNGKSGRSSNGISPSNAGTNFKGISFPECVYDEKFHLQLTTGAQEEIRNGENMVIFLLVRNLN